MPFIAKCLTGIFFIISISSYSSKASDYRITSIPDSLKKDAAAVVILDSVALDIPDISGFTYTVVNVISVLDASMDKLAVIGIPYYDQEVVKNFTAWLYDAQGNLVKHADSTQIMDVSGTPQGELASTFKYKAINLKKINAPYTIKYTYQKQVTGTFFLPAWLPAFQTGVSIEHATMSVSCGENVQLNYKTYNCSDPTISGNNFSWEIKNLCAVKKEDYGPEIYKLLPYVDMMLRSYELYQIKGSAASWNDIGVFINSLSKGTDELKHISDPALNNILNSKEDKLSKAKALYKYLQDNFRYVAIALGIGGWRPQEASFTLKKKYGDCKALVVMMKTLLEKADIPSYYTLVSAGEDQIQMQDDFPNAYFNHVILCVPMETDTVWLECTNNEISFNYLGNFTTNRKALLVFDGGARLINTPVYNETNNISGSKTEIKPGENNDISINASLTKKGISQDYLRAALNQKDDKAIEAAIYRATQLKNTIIKSHTIKQISSDLPNLSMDLELTNENAIRKTDSRLFIKTDILTPVSGIPDKKERRVQPVKIAVGYMQTDTLIYDLSTGYLPENFKVEQHNESTTKFGYANCQLQYSASTGQLQLIRNFCLKQATYPAEDYSALRDFFLKAQKECCPELVLKKKE